MQAGLKKQVMITDAMYDQYVNGKNLLDDFLDDFTPNNDVDKTTPDNQKCARFESAKTSLPTSNLLKSLKEPHKGIL